MQEYLFSKDRVNPNSSLETSPVTLIGWCVFCGQQINTAGLDQWRKCAACCTWITPKTLKVGTPNPRCVACSSINLIVNFCSPPSPHAAELRCGDCDRWQKWVSKTELAQLKGGAR